MFQIFYGEGVLYIKANNCVEEKEWMDVLTKICQTNKNRLKDYHPSAFKGSQWLCCKETTESATGCCPVSKNLPHDIAIHIDPDREVARIHSLIINRMNIINDLLRKYSKEEATLSTKEEEESNPSLTVSSGSSAESKSSISLNSILVEDPQSFCPTLHRMKQLSHILDEDQKVFIRRECEEIVYGSEKAPIGDNNYLALIAKHLTRDDRESNF
jgi:Ras GTPase-activating protein 3